MAGNDGPSLVFLHGLAESRASWNPVVRLLSPRFRCVSIDLRGHGESIASDKVDVPTASADVACVCRKLGLDHPVIVGHSIGGPVAILAAQSWAVGGVVTIDAPFVQADLIRYVQERKDQVEGSAFSSFFAELRMHMGAAEVSAEFRHILRAAVDRALVLSYWQGILELDPDDALPFAPLVSGLGRNYLSILGLPPPAGYDEWFASVLPDAGQEHWSRAGHWVHLSRTAMLADRIETFATAVDPVSEQGEVP
jgi:pimeloyl-ACP methyl ester carboxylesterase